MMNASTALNQSKPPSNPLSKIPPHSLEAEQSVLGGLMLSPEAWDTVVTLISKQDFYRPEHQIVFDAICQLIKQNKAVDILTVIDVLESSQALERVGGETYLYQLVHDTPTLVNIKAYADIVRERSILRQILLASQETAQSVYNREEQTVRDLLDAAERRIFSIAENHPGQTGPVKIGNVLAKAVDRLDALQASGGSITGLSTGFKELDRLTSGLQPADLILVAGRPSMGKTSFAMNIAEHAVLNSERPVLVFSMEMPSEMLAMRLMSSLGRVNQHHVRTGQLTDNDWPRVTSAISLLSEKPLLIDDTPALTPIDLQARARRVAREQGDLGLIVIDYLQLMRTAGRVENRAIEMGEISRSVKSLAKELHVPVLALSQLNRSLEQRQDRRPTMSDLRDSGALEQDADVILFIYRDEVYDKQTTKKGMAEIIIAKQRNGPIGNVDLTFLGEYTRFENLADEVASF